MLSIQEYITQIQTLRNPSFQKIRNIACDTIAFLSTEEKKSLFNSLGRGVDLLKTHEQLCQYLYSYGKMHEAKIHTALNHLKSEAYSNKTIQIIDWGCGQGLATVCFIDYFSND